MGEEVVRAPRKATAVDDAEVPLRVTVLPSARARAVGCQPPAAAHRPRPRLPGSPRNRTPSRRPQPTKDKSLKKDKILGEKRQKIV